MIKRILRNFSWLSVAVAAELGLSMVVTAVLARSLGVMTFGKYSLWLSFIAFFTPLYDFGLGPFSLREVAQSPDTAAYHVRSVWRVKVILGGFGLAVVTASAYLLGYFDDLILGVAFLLLAISQVVRTFSVLNRAILRAHEWMHLQAYIESASNLGRLLLVLTVVLLDPNLVWICLALATVNFGEFLVTFRIIQARTSHTLSRDKEDQRKGFRDILKASVPFALYDLFNGMYMRADSVLVGTIAGLQAVAWYVAAYKIVTLIGLLPRTLMDGIYPILCKESKEAVLALTRKLFVVFALAAFPLCLVVTLFSPEIIGLIYGSQYQPASLALQTLIWASFFVFGSSLLLAVLNASKQERRVAKISGIISVTGVVAYFLCISRWGYLGASAVSVGIEAAGLLLMFIVASREFERSPLSFGSFWRIVLAYGITVTTVWFLGARFSKVPSIFVALLLYFMISVYEVQRSTGILTISRLAMAKSHLLSILRVVR